MNESKNILFIQPSLEGVGGIEKVIPVVADTMSRYGITVSTYVFYGQVPERQGFWSAAKAGDESSTTGIVAKLLKVHARVKTIIAFVEEISPTHIIVSAQGAIIITLLLKIFGFLRVPVIAYIHEGRNDGGRLYRIITALIYPFADGFVGVSDGICNEISNIPFIKKENIVRAYNSIDMKSGGVAADINLVKKISLLARPVYVSAGRFEYTKGVDVLVESWLDYAKKQPGTLLLIGDGSLSPKIRTVVQDRGLEDRVCFLGSVPDARPYIAMADVYISCARSEPFGLALIEALAAGIPVIATDVRSGPREVLAPGQEIKEYPFRGIYGILTKKPVVKQEENSQALEKGILLWQEKPYDSAVLKTRAMDFTPEKQYDAIVKLVSKM